MAPGPINGGAWRRERGAPRSRGSSPLRHSSHGLGLVPKPASYADVCLGMATYRAYLLNTTGRITWGEWFAAASHEEAKAVALSRCKQGAPTVELWHRLERVGTYRCPEREIDRAVARRL